MVGMIIASDEFIGKFELLDRKHITFPDCGPNGACAMNNHKEALLESSSECFFCYVHSLEQLYAYIQLRKENEDAVV